MSNVRTIVLMTGLALAHVSIAMQPYHPHSNGVKKFCNICFTSHRINKFQDLSCGHSTCIESLKSMVDVAVKDKSLLNFKCPSCKKRIVVDDLRKLGVSAEKIKVIEEILRPKKRDQSGVDASSSSWMKKNSKPCPECESPIEKDGGCNHMTCIPCGHQFCWVCLKPWTCSPYRCLNGPSVTAQPTSFQSTSNVQSDGAAYRSDPFDFSFNNDWRSRSSTFNSDIPNRFQQGVLLGAALLIALGYVVYKYNEDQKQYRLYNF